MNWLSLELWLKGLLAAAITGAANCISVIIVDPDHFSPSAVGGFKKLGAIALGGGIVGAVMYLKQSPVPNNKGA